MVRLTEEMIVARTRVSDMANVKKLNCWGAELTDISVLRKLLNVEVLSLSVNCISTLADIQNCKNLQELYIRKNRIPDLSEICWLRNLNKLKSLWLEENHCVAQLGDMYRLTVIRNLPQLQKLDNLAVQPDELADAMRRGLELVHPLERDPMASMASMGGMGGMPQPNFHTPVQYMPSPHQAAPVRRSSSPAEAPAPHHNNNNGDYYYSGESRRASAAAQYDQQPSSRRVSNQSLEQPSSRRASSTRDSAESGYMVRRSSGYLGEESPGYGPEFHTGRRISQHEEAALARRASQPQGLDDVFRRTSLHESSPYLLDPDDRMPNSYAPAVADMASMASMPAAPRRASSASYFGPASDVTTPSYGYQGGTYDPAPVYQRRQDGDNANASPNGGGGADSDSGSDGAGAVTPPTNNNNLTLCDVTNSHNGVNGNGSGGAKASRKEAVSEAGRAVLAQHYEHTFEQVNAQMEAALVRAQIADSRPGGAPNQQRRPKNRNSNILSAVLCLIKELDAPSLEVVEMAVRCRMEELDD